MAWKSRPLLRIWWYWTLVNATSFSTYVLAIALAGMVGKAIEKELAAPAMMIVALLGVIGVGMTQQVVLSNTSLQNENWAFLLYVGLLFGLIAACAGLLPTACLVSGTLGAILGTGIVSFLFGAALGGLQSSGYTRNYRAHAIWIVTSGLGVVALVYVQLGFFLNRSEPELGDVLLAAMCGGGAYGAVSGIGLAWLLHRENRPAGLRWFGSILEPIYHK